ncbi:uroporphyrin-3 C-methyltransferase [Litorivivens lipolytica]|uniref:Uroporphyrin-3 C-methyltransferase n=1 Tax=Litorivivens lipolytica TaxID=1524264 RepID=A0A7W4W7D8_9GAMM|nr:uroporphyrinogen-III C-methyltransferase [Litorivivens lipolytica]MBB3048775.1 uroporphyrin-3 C-methyltransferase [Litorivivens lipolytica]
MSDTDKPEQPSSGADNDAPETAPPVLTEKQSAPETTPKAKPENRRGGGFTLFIALLAFLLSGASAGWLGYQFWLEQQASQEVREAAPWRDDLEAAGASWQSEARKAQRQSLSELREQLNEQDSELREMLKRQQLSAENARQLQNQRVTSLRTALDEQQSRLSELARLNRDDWVLAEADYLLRLARQQVRFGGDLNSAESLAREAQKHLQMVADPKVQDVLEILGRELTALSEAAAFSVEDHYDRLLAVSEQARQLQPLADHKVEIEEVAAAEETPPPLAWETLWDHIKFVSGRALDKLDSYIKVSDRDARYQSAVIAGGQRELFQHNLELMLEQARWALVSGNQALYEKALQRSSDWVRRYYRDEDAEQALLAALDELAKQRVRPEAPPLQSSINAITLYMDERQHAGAAK